MSKRTGLQSALPAATISLALLAAAPALGAPAGDEYLPAEPSATGDQDGGGGGEGSESGVAATGSGSASASAGSDAGGTGKADAKAGDSKEQGGDESIPVTQASSSDDDSGGVLETLLDPIVLLLIGGVGVVAVGMTLMRRHGDDEGQDGDRALRDPATVPPTPDGEIVAGGERRS